jgi:hypothetical protein
MPECFFSHLGGCQGPTMVKAHLVPKSRLKVELRGRVEPEELWSLLWHPAVWRWMSGGLSNLAGHHGMFDAKQIKLDEPPEDLVEFLRGLDLEWMVDAYV